MKMREALVQCELFLGNVSRHGHPMLNPGDKCTACDGVEELRGLVVRALSAPARQCDVGTPEEQVDRYCRHCQKHCISCERRYACNVCGERYRLRCIARWAQTPYEAERKGEGDA